MGMVHPRRQPWRPTGDSPDRIVPEHASFVPCQSMSLTCVTFTRCTLAW